MIAANRADGSVVGRWWWTIDRLTLTALAMLIAVGMLMTVAASPAVAERIGLDAYAFVRKQLVYLPAAAAVMLGVSLLGPRGVRRLALLGFAVAFAFTAATLIIGAEIKGARRWISLPGMSLQPSEFLKPCFAVLAAWLFAEGQRANTPVGAAGACLMLALVLAVLKMQPDIGMAAVVLGVFLAQWFVAGLRLFWVGVLGGLVAGIAVAAYSFFPHVQSRVHRFLDPAAGDNYQVSTALDAFANGGLVGRGPGEGRVKNILPDAHADFVFAVAGEEFGMLVCLAIIGLFAFVVIRGFARLLAETDTFVIIAATGLLTQFGLQAFINMASSLHLIPTKGMTLPFVSYGGSSVFAVALGMGMLLALTRRRHHGEAG
ncbi:FtsW/RodA/SpoVE family cell cycle protein [Elioraea sp.]|uniref:FtsW/RodA/SpoVE family cell cycle protein n=1 Tax=Elioraea sp. TaxID=2185103 RepID=UPI0025C1D742|nr:putative peptidoglycan glycosyltransferase FtsW [Elioraea sp.]